MEGYPIGLCIGLALGLSLAGDVCVDVGSNFKDAANNEAITTEVLCNELMRDGGFVTQLNDALKYQRVSITSLEDCKAAFQISPKP